MATPQHFRHPPGCHSCVPSGPGIQTSTCLTCGCSGPEAGRLSRLSWLRRFAPRSAPEPWAPWACWLRAPPLGRHFWEGSRPRPQHPCSAGSCTVLRPRCSGYTPGSSPASPRSAPPGRLRCLRSARPCGSVSPGPPSSLVGAAPCSRRAPPPAAAGPGRVWGLAEALVSCGAVLEALADSGGCGVS